MILQPPSDPKLGNFPEPSSLCMPVRLSSQEVPVTTVHLLSPYTTTLVNTLLLLLEHCTETAIITRECNICRWLRASARHHAGPARYSQHPFADGKRAFKHVSSTKLKHVKVHIIVFWAVTSSRTPTHFGGPYCFQLQGRKVCSAETLIEE
ncbi:uncharacterized protein LOC111869685 [Cryptotermes secundus]|uniref:uncharacterized protein LOC111869685 n=1 Tax=Cryptotermes secundus TaxID=105785 RepID=UPI000CD7CCA2|nr:uncharacterized protein LOC111869685 [Cryptotermes secundus]